MPRWHEMSAAGTTHICQLLVCLHLSSSKGSLHLYLGQMVYLPIAPVNWHRFPQWQWPSIHTQFGSFIYSEFYKFPSKIKLWRKKKHFSMPKEQNPNLGMRSIVGVNYLHSLPNMAFTAVQDCYNSEKISLERRAEEKTSLPFFLKKRYPDETICLHYCAPIAPWTPQTELDEANLNIK